MVDHTSIVVGDIMLLDTGDKVQVAQLCGGVASKLHTKLCTRAVSVGVGAFDAQLLSALHHLPLGATG
jgi:hypothetical protein